MPIAIGQDVGPYRITEKLGQGGMATVYKAYHAGLDRYVALKVLHPDLTEDPTFTARFQREARLVAKLEHPNIVPVHDFAEHDGHPYLVMKFIEGETLKARLEQDHLTLNEITTIVDSVGSALAYAHQQGILHRDIKPSNVLIAKDGQIYLADFGLARIAQASASTLSSDAIIGTPQYLSPEQAKGENEVDERADIYSFGVMLYEMIVGQVPYNSDTPLSIIYDHIHSPLPQPRTLNPSVPENIERVLLKALAKEQGDRYRSISDMVSAFQSCSTESTKGAAPAMREPPVQFRQPPVIQADNTGATKNQKGRTGFSAQHTRRRFVIAMRDPWELPNDSIELPAPEPLPGPPPTINLLSSIVPPLMMFGVVLLYRQLNPAMDIRFMILMPLMSMAFPIGNLASYFFQRRSYKKKLVIREQNYRATLAKSKDRLDTLVQQQRSIMEREYPILTKLSMIATGRSSRRRLWWRRPADPDFLSLRLGTSSGLASFKVSLPKSIDQNEPLIPLAVEIIDAYHTVQKLPSFIDFKEAGSTAIAGKSETEAYGLARRLILDLLVHHSPQDVELVILTDTEDAEKRWEWLKWAPHTRAIYQGERNRRLAFDATIIDRSIEWLRTEFEERKNPESNTRKRKTPHKAIVVILDDAGSIRQTVDIKQLAASGYEVDIYLIFTGGRHWPRECRARIDVSGHEYTYVETWAGEKNNLAVKGEREAANLPECERVARALAGLEIDSGGGSSDLPESVRLYDLLDVNSPTEEEINQNWRQPFPDDELLHFSFGYRGGRKGLEKVTLNLLPEELNGFGAYHSILVGTTGSGKSEFMKSLVLSAAYQYSPRLLNFFFMDFKGGAAFNLLKDLPHVVGVVTNLSPELVERGLSAMEAEIDRRQKWFADENVQNIWAYNNKYPDQPMPHLLLLLDEFARGIEEFPRLPAMLDRLVRQGRSLGIYLLLANQDVNSAVDRLLNNVGWRIALKVARQEEMHMIDRSLPIPKRPGQGYLLTTNNDAIEFQAAYAGFRMAESQDEFQEAFKIYRVETDGRWQLIRSSAPKVVEQKKQTAPLEQDHLISVMAAAAQHIELARPIYLDPLEENIPLERVFGESAFQRIFDGAWRSDRVQNSRMLAPVGYLDSPQECIQEEMLLDFEDQDGHLWIAGAPGSGKAMTLETILLSLALTHTPEQVQFYILEYGAGHLLKFDALPHTGAVLRPTDSVERLDKLLNYLDNEMDRRTDRLGSENLENPDAHIFLVINNFAELRSNYPDHADRISRFARDGKAVGLHLIITTNRKIELGRILIARRIVLRLANRDEYMDAVGKSVPLPAIKAEGRGLWVVDRSVLECQIAQPVVMLDGSTTLQDAKTAMLAMRKSWQGRLPTPIRILPTDIPFQELLAQIPASQSDGFPVPVGLSFETQELIAPRLLDEIPRWLVLGPPRCGKSNFLVCVSNAINALEPENWEQYYISFRRSPLEGLDKERVHLAKRTEEIVEVLKGAIEFVDDSEKRKTGQRTLLLLDDLGGAFEPGKETLVQALNEFALKTATQDDIYLVATGMADELRAQQITSQLVRSLRQGRTGMCFSKNPDDMDWFGAQIPLQYRRMELPPGRGFWASGGKAILVQSPHITSE